MSARETALRVLTSCRVNGAWADAALKAQLARSGLSGPEAAMCSRIVYGVTQNRLLLDFYIAAYCSQRPDHLQPPLPDILRIGAYQILFLDRVPDSAAVNTSVELAKTAGRGQAGGLVNAVLRKISRNKENLPPIPARDEAGYLSVRYSHPKWLVKRLLAILGREGTEAFLSANNSQPPAAAQVNSLRRSAEQLRGELEAEGIAASPHPWLPDCLLLSGTGDLERSKAFHEGGFYIQDPAARLAVLAAGVRPEFEVLDLCAAPGGKSFAAAIAMGDRGTVFACDLYENKLQRVREGAGRLQLSCIRTFAADGRIPRTEWFGRFDAVLVDAPCSGFGIIRKKPDIRYKPANSLFSLPVVQHDLLDNAAAYVRPGGVLVYSTCTVLPEENGQTVDAFLVEHGDFFREKFSLPSLGEIPGEITLWPQCHGTDGFYICRLRRQARE